MASDLQVALDPKSIAVIGASNDTNKIGGRPLFLLSRFGFRGQVYAINPNRPEVQGLKTFGRLSDIGNAPDMAIIAVPGDAAVHALEECADVGVKVAVMMASGFGESDPENGKERERQMGARARAKGTRVVGPNSQGLANFGTGAIASFSTMFVDAEPGDGPVGIVSQSGAMSVVPYGLLRQKGIGVRHAHATGNDCDVTACELAIAVAQDPAVRLLILYLEGIPDPHNLIEVAKVASNRKLPVVVLKSGRTAAGQAAATSHTGALANEDRVVDAFLEKCGMWRAVDTTDLVAAAELYLQGWHPSGRRMVAVSTSGATCVLAADAASMAGLAMQPLSAPVQSKLKIVLPSYATVSNPVDLTAALLGNGRLMSQVLPALAEDASVDSYFLGFPVAGAGYDLNAIVQDTANFVADIKKPVVIAAPQPALAARFKEKSLCVFSGEGEAVRALYQFVAHHELMARARPHAMAKPVGEAGQNGVAQMFNEDESLSFLRSSDVPPVAYRLCKTVDEARRAYADMGKTVVLKACSRDVAHKSELGLVRVAPRSEQEVADTFTQFAKVLEGRNMHFDGIIVAKLAHGRMEMLIGAHRDPVFGPVVLIGSGGKYVEAVLDVRTLLPPFSQDDVRSALMKLRIAPILRGTRGEKPVALDTFCRCAVAVGELMLSPAAAVSSVDINPILAGEEESDCVALDAVVFKTS